MKKFRKISALMLALALICALAATAFATSFDLDFPVAGRTVTVAGNMSQWSVIGEIYVDGGEDTGDLRRASVEFWYIKNNGASTSTVKWNPTIVDTIHTGHAAQAKKTFTANEKTAYKIVCMSYAAETFRAYVPYENGSGTELFTEGPDYVSYLMQ